MEGENETKRTEGKTTRSIKQMACAGRERSLGGVCDQLRFLFFVKVSGTRGKRG